MAETSTNTEKSESMEEILQSIKRIMDDNTGAETKPTEADDVFDLTNVVKDNGTMEENLPTAKMPQPAANSEDVVKSIDSIFAGDAAPDANKKLPSSENMESGLMSENTVNAAATAFRKIADNAARDYSLPNLPSPEFRNGNTVEDLVLETLRPMLKEWLDENLPIIVQKIVEKEVKRIVSLAL